MESSAQFVRRLKQVTRDCRPDMHEPDEQLDAAVLLGTELDNAMPASPAMHAGEFIIGLKPRGGEMEWFNLATMIAILKNSNIGDV